MRVRADLDPDNASILVAGGGGVALEVRGCAGGTPLLRLQLLPSPPSSAERSWGHAAAQKQSEGVLRAALHCAAQVTCKLWATMKK